MEDLSDTLVKLGAEGVWVRRRSNACRSILGWFLEEALDGCVADRAGIECNEGRYVQPYWDACVVDLRNHFLEEDMPYYLKGMMDITIGSMKEGVIMADLPVSSSIYCVAAVKIEEMGCKVTTIHFHTTPEKQYHLHVLCQGNSIPKFLKFVSKFREKDGWKAFSDVSLEDERSQRWIERCEMAESGKVTL